MRIPLCLNEQQLLIRDDAVHGKEVCALFFEGERSRINLHETGFESGHIIDPNLGGKEGSGQENPGKPIGSNVVTEVHSFST